MLYIDSKELDMGNTLSSKNAWILALSLWIKLSLTMTK